MESSGPIPTQAVAAPELAELVARPGPFVTVYLTTAADIENAAYRSEQRWKTVRAALADQGAPGDWLARIDPLVADAHQEGQCLAVVLSADGTCHVEHHPDLPKADIGRYAAIPTLGPLIEWRQHAIPTLVVLIDRVGADVITVSSNGTEAVTDVRGSEYPVTKSAPGGWSQRRYQQRAENTWEENAETAAVAVSELAAEIGARLIVVAGDVRAVQMLKHHLRDELRALVEHVDGGRSPDGSTDAVAREVARLVATVAAADTRTLLEKFREERGQHDRAVDGPVATIAALNEARVGALLVPGDVDQEETAWFGSEPIPVAMSPSQLHDVGIENPQHGGLVDVIIHAALGTGASVRVIPKASGPTDGIGAILRW